MSRTTTTYEISLVTAEQIFNTKQKSIVLQVGKCTILQKSIAGKTQVNYPCI